MEEQNNYSSNRLNLQLSSKDLDLKVKEIASKMEIEDTNKEKFQRQVEDYEKQLSKYSQMKQQLMRKLKNGNHLVFSQSKANLNMTNPNYHPSYFQKQENFMLEQMNSNISIRVTNSQNKTSLKGFLNQKQKLFGFIPFTPSVQDFNINKSDLNKKMENVSLKIIPQSPKKIKNLIIYQSK